MRDDSEYLQLLQADYNILLKELQPLLRFAVNEICVAYSMPDFVEELLSTVNEELLIHRFDKIKQTYTGQTKLTTYIFTVVTNYSKDVIRAEQTRKNRSDVFDEDSEFYSESSSDSKALIRDELNRLHQIISLSKHPARLFSCLKIFANLELLHADIQDTLSEVVVNTQLTTVPSELLYFNENEQQRFTLLANVLSKFDNKDMQGDSLRRWSDRKINDIISVLNGNPPKKSYTKDSFRILIEYYFSNKMSESA